MTELTTLRPSINSSPQASALALELAKILKLVAPVSMDDQAQIAWLTSAVDALEGISAAEVAAISAELRRSVTRHAQIVPAIADKVAERRRRRVETGSIDTINAERMKHGFGAVHWVNGKCEFVDEPDRVVGRKPLTAREVENMPKWLRDMGLRIGFLKRAGDTIVDANA